MTLLNALFIYFLIWWTTLFVVLPLGVERNKEEGRGFDWGAPAKADLKKKLFINTVLAAAVLAVIEILILIGVIRWEEWFR